MLEFSLSLFPSLSLCVELDGSSFFNASAEESRASVGCDINIININTDLVININIILVYFHSPVECPSIRSERVKRIVT